MTTIDSIGFGWLPDVPSHKDYGPDNPQVSQLLSQTRNAGLLAGLGSVKAAPGKGAQAVSRGAAAAAPAIAATMDLRAYCSPIENQGALGSCTANAAAG